MPRVLSGIRYAESGLDLVGADTTSAELDFNLGFRDGIELIAVQGYMRATSLNFPTTPTSRFAVQTLHLEPGTLEDIGGEPLDYPSFDRDRELVYRQQLVYYGMNDTTNGTGGVGVSLTPNELCVLPMPIPVAVNPSHFLESFIATQVIIAIVGMWYRYVEFSDAELAMQFARRR